jgi:hypothetical protein
MQEEIDAFLTEQQDLDDDADSDFEAEAASAPPPAKKQKAAGGGAAPTPPAGDFAVQLAPERFASVRQYGGRTMVDVREFYEKEGSLQARAAAAPLACAFAAAALRMPVAAADSCVAPAPPPPCWRSLAARAWRCRRQRGMRWRLSWAPSAPRCRRKTWTLLQTWGAPSGPPSAPTGVGGTGAARGQRSGYTIMPVGWERKPHSLLQDSWLWRHQGLGPGGGRSAAARCAEAAAYLPPAVLAAPLLQGGTAWTSVSTIPRMGSCWWAGWGL